MIKIENIKSDRASSSGRVRRCKCCDRVLRQQTANKTGLCSNCSAYRNSRHVRPPSSAGRVRRCGSCDKVLKKQNSKTGYCSSCYQAVYNKKAKIKLARAKAALNRERMYSGTSLKLK